MKSDKKEKKSAERMRKNVPRDSIRMKAVFTIWVTDMDCVGMSQISIIEIQLNDLETRY